jgi:hypothetical protein
MSIDQRRTLLGPGQPAGNGWPRWSCRPPTATVIEDDLGLIDALAQPIGRLDSEVHQRAKAEPGVKVLTHLPDVGRSPRSSSWLTSVTSRGRGRRRLPRTPATITAPSPNWS